jgi:hypothetical protein
MNRHIVLTENSVSCCLIQAYFTVVPWQSTPLLFLTGHAPLSSGRFLSSAACVFVKAAIGSHGFVLLLGLAIFIDPGM